MSESRDKKARRPGADSNDPLQESLDELARIADVLVDRLALDCDSAGSEAKPGARRAAAPARTRDDLKSSLDQLDRLVETTGPTQNDADVASYLDKILRTEGEVERDEALTAEPPIARQEPVGAPPRPAPLVEAEEVVALAPWPLAERVSPPAKEPVVTPAPKSAPAKRSPSRAFDRYAPFPAPVFEPPASTGPSAPKPLPPRPELELGFPPDCRREKRGLPLGWIAAAALVGIGLLGYLWMGRGETPRSPASVATPSASAEARQDTPAPSREVQPTPSAEVAPVPSEIPPEKSAARPVAEAAGPTSPTRSEPAAPRSARQAAAPPAPRSTAAKVRTAPNAAQPAPQPLPAATPEPANVFVLPGSSTASTATPPPVESAPPPVSAVATGVPPAEPESPPARAEKPARAPEPPAAPPRAVIAPYAPPKVRARVEPLYPASAKKKGERGEIVLKVLVNETGGVARVVVEKGLPGSEIETAAISAVLRWTYQPATENGHAVRGWVSERFVFKP